MKAIEIKIIIGRLIELLIVQGVNTQDISEITGPLYRYCEDLEKEQ